MVTRNERIAGVVTPPVLAEQVLDAGNTRGVDTQLPGPAEPVGWTRFTCLHCGHTAAYPLIERGVTRCAADACGGTLRP